ncbi:MAG: PhoH family protein [Proteobacteria bacterium]|nr:PhoH family protein [Pseudomonadota bacterium]
MSDHNGVHLEFADNVLFSQLVGPADTNIAHIENRFGVVIAVRGNHISISGSDADIDAAKSTLQYLYAQLTRGKAIDALTLEEAIRIVSSSVSFQQNETNTPNGKISIATKRKIIFPRTVNQGEYLSAMQAKDMIFGIGPAGTGKTYLAVAVGVSMLIAGKVDKIILTRPAVEAGEKLGFLPGDMREKVDPYLRPLYDAMHDMLPADQVERRLTNGEIEIAPLAFMRGRTLSNAFVILDEAQNTTPVQMKMFLTRLGHNARMVITGDLSQIDLPIGIESGLKQAVRVLKNIPDISFVVFDENDVVRHPIVSKIVAAYDKEVKA